MNIKAIVTKIEENKGIFCVMTEDRQFLKLSLSEYNAKLGETLDIDLPETNSDQVILFNQKIQDRLWTKNRKWISIAAVFLIFFISFYVNTWVISAAAYVDLDMKTSMQLSVNKEGKVIEIVPLNIEAEKMIQSLNIENKNIYEAVREIMKKSIELGYFEEQRDNIVMASITALKEANAIVDESQLRTIIDQEMSAKRYPGYVVINQANSKQWEIAKKSGYSMNQFMVLEQAKQNGVHLKDIKNEHLSEVMVKNNIQVTTLFPEHSQKVSWENSEMYQKNHPSNEWNMNSNNHENWNMIEEKENINLNINQQNVDMNNQTEHKDDQDLDQPVEQEQNANNSYIWNQTEEIQNSQQTSNTEDQMKHQNDNIPDHDEKNQQEEQDHYQEYDENWNRESYVQERQWGR